ncbi:MAG: tryptophan synthase subunit beta, partial [Alphaproteobacteria bacterium]|nr:tryptophan synthase subunit beta [Alphaproteobacteria bacterium]
MKPATAVIAGVDPAAFGPGADLPLDPKAALQALLEGRFPDARGRFGPFGGRFVPETLVPALDRLEAGARAALSDPAFLAELQRQGDEWIGRPTPLCRAERLGERYGVELWLKREDLNHTGAHKVNNAIGQALLAKRLGATRIIAETGAGQHGVASAAACARVGLPCVVYMGAVDIERQAPNVDRMKRLGAEVVPVTKGDATLRAAIDEALRDWVSDPQGTYYLLGSAVGPHPYPWLVRELQKIIGQEARAQVIERTGGLPDAVVACVGGGSNAIGLFHPFLGDAGVRIIGAEAGGSGGLHAATCAEGEPGVLHGCHSLLLQDEHGQIHETHSVSAGLDYPGVGPEHALLAAIERVDYVAVSDAQALEAVDDLCRFEGILPALESAHALAYAKVIGREAPGSKVLVGLSGRGDKDMPTLLKVAGG